MKNLKDPKIFIPLIIVLIALGAIATSTLSGGSDMSGSYSHGDHGHEH